MRASVISRQATQVRAITRTDTRNILRMVDTAWRVHIRISPVELGTKIKVMPGFLAEDNGGLGGFMVIEPQHPDVALIVAAGLRDTWGVKSYLDLVLPQIERLAQAENLLALAHIGNVTWLVDELRERGFETREWIIAFERHGTEAPPPTSAPALVRPAHYSDMHAILTLDALAFDHIWRKSLGSLSEALASADSFTIAELDGRVVGYEWWEKYYQHAHLTRLAVQPGYQGHGIGAQLLHKAITDALASGVNMITLNTQENNYRSRTLYERFGFVYANQRMPVLWKNLW